MRGDLYQVTLVSLGIVVVGLFGVFFYRELFPEYLIYQNNYNALEDFRSTYTGEAPPMLKTGIKQLVFEDKNKGPEKVDRCISCHVALEFEHFSPTKIAYDINGNMKLDADGFPVKEQNPEYVWAKLENKINELKKINPQDQQIAKYEALLTAKVGDQTYDMKKVLAMHPLIGRETRPFSYHPIQEYGCTSCHNGNGRGLTTNKAHGPIFDGHYEEEFMGPSPHFLEKDPVNDPKFSQVFNHKPGSALLFQTTPLFVGSLIEANCVQCHKTSKDTLQSAYTIANVSTSQRLNQHDAVVQAYETEIEALNTLLTLHKGLQEQGFDQTYALTQKQASDYTLPAKKREEALHQSNFLRKNQHSALTRINAQLNEIVGSPNLVKQLLKLDSFSVDSIKKFIVDHPSQAQGSIFSKYAALDLEKALISHVKTTEESLQQTIDNEKAISAMATDVDLLTKNYQRGHDLFISQACYACHRIAGLSHGGVGPELTEEGYKYPWFIKEAIVWPQANLKTSTMPNFKLDHEEQEALMTFILGQKGRKKSDSETTYKVAIQEWENGKKINPWEKSITPLQMQNLDYAMEVFATEGCASCHRLKGYQSNVGFAIEKNNTPTFESLYQEKEWFKNLFPEEILGTEMISTIENHTKDIDERIVNGVRENSILEKIKEKHPLALETLYSNFKYALRAKNDKMPQESQAWKERIHKILMVYIQEYGLGRLIGPRPNWSGVYRSDEWLMEHFFNPGSHVARSIMPVLPFSNNKFYALTHMLDVLGRRNSDEVRAIWENQGFNPELAYQIHCSQCHGDYMQGNGPVSDWIYPIPKNLRNAEFLKNLTRKKAYESIFHGVKGTPMPPWGEIGKDKPIENEIPVLTSDEVVRLVDWIYSSVPSESIIRDSGSIPKWNYSPEDAIEEMKKEGNILDSKNEKDNDLDLSALVYQGNDYAALVPRVNKQSTISKNEVQDYFDIEENPPKSLEKNSYYIKKKFYTPDNILAGKNSFSVNCAVCHGREADGSGNRAGSMVNAKPRMLTNLDWLDTRDDLRLLRSIKYGVPGTAMVAWGDQTSSKQRMQLVMYIRTLSEENKLREHLSQDLYRSYNRSEQFIEQVRTKKFPQLAKIEEELREIKEKRALLDSAVKNNQANAEEALELYQQELLLSQELSQAQRIDQELLNLIKEIKAEKLLMEELGIALIAIRNEGIDLNDYHQILQAERNRLTFEDHKLQIKDVDEDKIKNHTQQLLNHIDTSIEQLKLKNIQVKGKIENQTIRDTIKNNDEKIKTLQDMRNKIISTLEEGKRLHSKQKALINKSPP